MKEKSEKRVPQKNEKTSRIQALQQISLLWACPSGKCPREVVSRMADLLLSVEGNVYLLSYE